MRNVPPSSSRWVTLAWLLPFVLLALPNCGLQSGGCVPGSTNCPIVDDCEENDSECQDPDPCEEDPSECEPDPCEEDPSDPECVPPDPVEIFEPGEDPSDAIFCDIPKPLAPGDDGCASQAEADEAANISLSEAAIALVNGETATFALDFSEAATTACSGLPKKIEYFGEYPQGMRVCINCSTQIDIPYANPTKACRAKCIDQVNANGVIPAEGASDYCEANAKVSTNFDPAECQHDACTLSGSPNMSWVDPRETPEPVKWIDHIGTDDNGGSNTLTRVAATTGGTTADFNAGAASEQVFTSGDGWVEFEAGDATNTVHVLGLRESCAVPANCGDTDPHIETVGFAIDLNSDGQVYVLEPGTTPGTFDVYGPFGTYTVGERYRIRVTDTNLTTNSRATIAFSRVVGGVEQPPFATNTAANPLYPLRVDTTFREQDASVVNVNMVYIKFK